MFRVWGGIFPKSSLRISCLPRSIKKTRNKENRNSRISAELGGALLRLLLSQIGPPVFSTSHAVNAINDSAPGPSRDELQRVTELAVPSGDIQKAKTTRKIKPSARLKTRLTKEISKYYIRRIGGMPKCFEFAPSPMQERRYAFGYVVDRVDRRAAAARNACPFHVVGIKSGWRKRGRTSAQLACSSIF